MTTLTLSCQWGHANVARMNRKHTPVRTPRGLHDEISVVASELGISVAEYLYRISAPELVEKLQLEAEEALASSTWFHPRTERVERVREVARAHSKRQWEVWQALHKLYRQQH